MDKTKSFDIDAITVHVTGVTKFSLDPGETLLIYCDKAKTCPADLDHGMKALSKMFPHNRVLVVSSDYSIAKAAPWTKIPLKTDSLWERFKNLLYRAYKV